MARPEPNFAGFAEAQKVLRDKFGQDITFYLPGSAEVWPPGTQVDPETGKPYDPTIEPVSGGEEDETVVRCSVVSRPMGLSKRGIDAEVQREAIGWIEEGGVVLIVNTEDQASIAEATGFDYAGERYEIRQSDDDYLGPVHRYLVWGRQAGKAS